LKYAMRKSAYYEQFLGDSSFRTRNLDKAKAELVKALKDEFKEELIEDAANRFVAAVTTNEEDEENEGGDTVEMDAGTEKQKKRAVAPWVTEEIRVLCGIIQQVKEEGLSAD